MDFKKILKNDVHNIFLNTAEFADIHIINGKEITAVLQEDTLDNIKVNIEGTNQRQGNGIYSGGMTAYIAAGDMPKPKPQSILEIDGKKYTVASASKVGGMYEINLRRFGAR